MNLSESLEYITLQDLQWAVSNKYQTDIKWVAINIVSILSNKSRLSQNKKDFKKLTGKTLYVPSSSPANSWSGWYKDVIYATCIITGLDCIKVERELYCLTRNHTSRPELKIRLRRFESNKKNPVYGESEHLKKDVENNFYVWDYNRDNKLIQVPEQYLKQQLIMWEEYICTLN